MSDLISRDYLLDTIDVMIVGHKSAGDVYDMVEDAPAVEAIPISFIKSMIDLAKRVNAFEYAENLQYLLDDWKEQEERKEE